MRKMTLQRLLRSLLVLLVCSTTATLLSAAEPATPGKAPTAAKPPAAESTAARADEDGKDSTEQKAGETKASEPSVKDGAAAAKPGEAKDAADEDEAAPPPDKGRASAADGKASPQRFVPSEQVRADFDVSFPIDI